MVERESTDKATDVDAMYNFFPTILSENNDFAFVFSVYNEKKKKKQVLLTLIHISQ